MAPSTVDTANTSATTPTTTPDSHDVSNVVSNAMEREEARMAEARRKDEEKREQKMAAERRKDLEGGKTVIDQKMKALDFLLSQSQLYSKIMLEQMQRQEEVDTAKDDRSQKKAAKREERADKAAGASQRRATRSAIVAEDQAEQAEEEAEDQKTAPKKGRGRPARAAKGGKGGKISDFYNKEDLKKKAGDTSIQESLAKEAQSDIKPGEIGMQELKSAKQPDLVTGGLMRTYQLEGLEWLISLYENGLNGILADEMGLGKTIQTISFIAFLREKGVNGPFLIAAPLSTTSNWVNEFKKFTPSIPVVLYHGSKPEREEIRRTKLKSPGSKDFPVICTSYEICMNDRKFLAHYGWKYIIIDEGHRIKNLDCRLIRELQSYQSANRLLITGTPLQNNLTELWSLLHFLMPTIFDKLESFESWFDFSALKEKNGHEQILSEEKRKNLVSSLHAILKPFLLRRVKADVETSLPKKREYVLYAPLTQSQQELYHEILEGDSRAYLENKAFETFSREATPKSTRSTKSLKRKALEPATPNKSAKSSRASTPATANGSRTRNKTRQNYEEVSDTQYFAQVATESPAPSPDPDSEASEEQTREQTLAMAKRAISAKKLQNPILQLRLCCNSPHNFFYPFTAPDDSDVDETLITESGKMLLLDRLLPTLLEKGHKVLIFSQFKTQLDLLETYCSVLRSIPVCRIDGSIPQSERQELINAFNSADSDINVFLLSTRAGGQGINLASADTVLLFDSDWNPQQDLQAQDRAHRIGQTRPVLVYRFATRGTVESMLLEKANSKRRLEKLVIQKGRFRNAKGAAEGDEFTELRSLLGRDDGERIDVREGGTLISDEELAVLTDRSPEAFERAEKGLDNVGGVFKAVETKRDGEGLLEQMETR